MENKQSKDSNYKVSKVDIETEKAFLALIDGFTDTPIWIPKSVVDPATKLINQWFIDQKNKELKDFQRTKSKQDWKIFCSILVIHGFIITNN